VEVHWNVNGNITRLGGKRTSVVRHVWHSEARVAGWGRGVNRNSTTNSPLHMTDPDAVASLYANMPGLLLIQLSHLVHVFAELQVWHHCGKHATIPRGGVPSGRRDI